MSREGAYRWRSGCGRTPCRGLITVRRSLVGSVGQIATCMSCQDDDLCLVIRDRFDEDARVMPDRTDLISSHGPSSRFVSALFLDAPCMAYLNLRRSSRTLSSVSLTKSCVSSNRVQSHASIFRHPLPFSSQTSLSPASVCVPSG